MILRGRKSVWLPSPGNTPLTGASALGRLLRGGLLETSYIKAVL
jgi:hypothetical protein